MHMGSNKMADSGYANIWKQTRHLLHHCEYQFAIGAQIFALQIFPHILNELGL